MAKFNLLKKIFSGSGEPRVSKKFKENVQAINQLESEMEKLSDYQLSAKTGEFKNKVKNGAPTNNLLNEAFAVVREASKRTLGQRHYDVQLIGGMILNEGKIAEMKTGEGKTLVSTLPAYLNSLDGNGSHLVTVNDYLAKRDSEWMGEIYKFLSLDVGCILHDLLDTERKKAYAADITYGNNNEYCFDYLRDNMRFHANAKVQRSLSYCIVDEVDSILIDEARTPLVISGAVQEKTDLYKIINSFIFELNKQHLEVDEKTRSINLTDQGIEFTEKTLFERKILKGNTLYDIENMEIVHHINQALKAHKLFTKEKEYIVKDDKVVIIDEFTGRMMEGRRYSDGLHQALEAKESVTIKNESQTLASITFQNYFRAYKKLSGMTGTALTEAEELMDIYKLEVIPVPTNKSIIRIDSNDEIYRTSQEKYSAILNLINERHERGQPILVGTTSIEKSEHVSKILKKNNIDHQVLNARHHEQEANIIAQAGCFNSVTIATNMAGRGIDIQLGGNLEIKVKKETEGLVDKKEIINIRDKIEKELMEEKEKVINVGGLLVIGTERHESRRIDNQLRGRSGRQGDPGSSKFFLSLDDDLMRIFGSERIETMLQKIGLKEGEAIVHPWISKALEKAQQKVEARNYDIRKMLIRFDDVLNEQRKTIYDQRLKIMEANDISPTIDEMRVEVIDEMIKKTIPKNTYPDQWDIELLKREVREFFALNLPIEEWSKEDNVTDEEMKKRIIEESNKITEKRKAEVGNEINNKIEKSLLLQTLDALWRDHIQQLEQLRQVIGLRGYGQRDPLNEYKYESFNLFAIMLSTLREKITTILSRVKVEAKNTDMIEKKLNPSNKILVDKNSQNKPDINKSKNLQSSTTIQNKELDLNNPLTWEKTPRNAKCPCGSNKKYKHCHGKL